MSNIYTWFKWAAKKYTRMFEFFFLSCFVNNQSLLRMIATLAKNNSNFNFEKKLDRIYLLVIFSLVQTLVMPKNWWEELNYWNSLNALVSWLYSIIRLLLLVTSYIIGTSVACAIGPSVTMSSTDFSFQNLVFWEFIWIFSCRNHFKINIYLPHSESKSYQINSIRSARSFQQHQPTTQSTSSENFSYD